MTKITNAQRRAIFTRAHQTARIRRFNSRARTYAGWFSEALRAEYANLRKQAQARIERELQRDEQNVGLPVRSRLADRPGVTPRVWFGGSRAVSAVGA